MQLESQRDELRSRTAAEAATHRRDARAAAMWMAFVSAFLLSIAIYNLVGGSKGAAVVALGGVIGFGALAMWLLRSRIDFPLETGEIERLSLTLDRNTVLVYEIRAESALAIGPPEADGEIWGDILQVGPDEVVYISRKTCSRVDAERLPNTVLSIERAVPFGVTKVEARGARISAAIRVTLSDQLLNEDQIPRALERFVPVELVPFSGDVADLARRLPETPAE